MAAHSIMMALIYELMLSRKKTRACTSALFATTRKVHKPVLNSSWEVDVSVIDNNILLFELQFDYFIN